MGYYYNVQRLEYHDFIQYRFYSHPIEKDFEKEKDSDDLNEKNVSIDVESRKKRSLEVSLNRTKQSIYEIAYNNKWGYFVTLTFSAEKVDRKDYNEIVKKLRKWCNNMRSNFAPDLHYIFIPEPHKDGAYHFHGLLADTGDMVFSDSGRVVKDGKAYKRCKSNAECPVIYNLDNWKFGFSTATVVRSNCKCVSYLTKYITKDLCQIADNRHRYLASRNLSRVKKECLNIPCEEIEEFIKNQYVCNNVEYDKSLSIPAAGQLVRYMTVKK